ncbi:MAG: hemerythrin family protein [Candidatus Marinimicrobia bacterium]|jgi:hemerythrin-like metal-binding protein|nr:hemerythrin family protein [Candidatus Neomarinimicrobiota bacterium]MBT3576768.1 hemerythrin family protein [Candidatus Neomarinimicrobiota bacterium]MBT3678976.1 hemerythrin family protein [Candidatus Neomarinimicrobiota bacterium]MBT3950233.1 hemerythrin family protein [Candidatus Neomarinimicrobiota bacterium]MBT4252153.1 hemerythrin family protein [Candidatus Neomarinimicrobiota bacterium]
MLSWDSSYSVGIQEIDDQHQKLIDFINELELALGKSDNRETVVKVLNGIVFYTKDHFAQEELYFRQFDYDKTDDHITEHADLITQVEKLVYQFEVNGTFDIPNVIEFLKAWLIEHILGADQEYVSCFKENGL